MRNYKFFSHLLLLSFLVFMWRGVLIRAASQGERNAFIWEDDVSITLELDAIGHKGTVLTVVCIFNTRGL